jgi:hypothetical protein
VADSLRDSNVPASRPAGPSGPRPPLPTGDRATPVADAGTDYSSYIVASAAASTLGRNTQRIQSDELARLVSESRTTAARKRPPALPAALDEQAKSAAPARRLRRLTPAVIGALGALAGGAALWTLLDGARLAATTGAPPISAATAIPMAFASAPVEPPAPVGADPPPAERQARAALERLRDGLAECIRHGIHGLPGSSPAVPLALASLKGGAYPAAPAEWRTSVWSCAHFQIHEPMSFQLQWQLVRPGVEGMGIAWIDADGNGVADRALGFSIKLGARGELELGDVEPTNASRPVVVMH